VNAVSKTVRMRATLALCCALASCASPPPEEQEQSDSAVLARDSGSSDAGSTAVRSDGATAPRPDIGEGGSSAGAFPFPQSKKSKHCAQPTIDPSAVSAAWTKWKAEAVVSDGAGGFLRVRRWENQNDTVSEGIAYGMMAAVYMNDQATFDGLWQYSQLHLGSSGLMHWRVDAMGRDIDGSGRMISVGERGAATDADEDIAWALIMAHYQWGGGGSLNRGYIELALSMIDLIWRFEVDHAGGEVLKPGDRFGGAGITNPSYFAPSYYRVFGKLSGKEADWNKVVDSSYEILALAADKNTGLVPAWCKADGSNAGREYYYQYDACRTPFRIAVDYCDNGEPRAAEYLRKVSGFFQNIGAANIKDGYELNGMARSMWSSAAFIGPAAVGAMVDSSFSELTSDAYTELLVFGERTPTQGYSYYNSSWHLLSLLMLSGNFLDYSHL
jgi:endo-1,4-beta-D-glucanase Y